MKAVPPSSTELASARRFLWRQEAEDTLELPPAGRLPRDFPRTSADRAGETFGGTLKLKQSRSFARVLCGRCGADVCMAPHSGSQNIHEKGNGCILRHAVHRNVSVSASRAALCGVILSDD